MNNIKNINNAKNLLSITDLNKSEILSILEKAEQFRKEKESNTKHTQFLKGKNIAMFFEKPSLRTKISFDSAVSSLGGNAILIDGREVAGTRESISDISNVLTGMVDGIFARVHEHSILTEMKENMNIPVLNALCNDFHPFQAFAELQTVMINFPNNFLEKKIVFIGDGCNVPTSLAQICAILGIDFEMCSPEKYTIPEKFWTEILKLAKKSGANITTSHIPTISAQNADVIVTDTWVSMGMEEEKSKRLKDFKDFSVTQDIMNRANKDAIFLHCLPAYRGLEVTEEVIDGKQSHVFEEAHCRLHTSKAILDFIYNA